MKNILFCLIAIILMLGCTQHNDKIDNVRAFSKIYGYVRWFYPSDEASQIDWNKFALYGVEKVEKAKNQDELIAILHELYHPIAPALLINPSGSKMEWKDKLLPKDTTDLFPVSWVHYGVFLGDKRNIYKSVRVNRDINDSYLIKNLIEIPENHDNKISLNFSYKTSGTKDTSSFIVSFFSNSDTISEEYMQLPPSKQYIRNKIEMTIPDQAKYLSFGISNDKLTDTLWFSDVEIALRENNNWADFALFNHNFTNGLAGWEHKNLLTEIEIDSSSNQIPTRGAKIFPRKIPKVGEYYEAKISDNLSVSFPLALYANKEKTFPVADTSLFTNLLWEIDQLSGSQLDTKNDRVKLANVVVAWNVIQHFYPYFDVVQVNWDDVLTNTITKAYKAKSEIDYYTILSGMVEAMEDGHGRISSNKIKRWFLKAKFEYIDNKVVVIDSRIENLKKGDIVLKINGKTAQQEIIKQEKFFSGSEQYKRSYAIQYFGSDFEPGKVHLIIEREGKKMKLKSNRINNFLFTEKNDNIFDLSNENYFVREDYSIKPDDIEEFAEAKGIVFENSYKKFGLLPHIIDQPILGPQIQVPITIYPDRLNTIYNNEQWCIYPKKPYINTKLVFITHSTDISSMETFLQIVKHYKLGTIVGEYTAGTNGNVNIIHLLGEYKIAWTGMKVLNHDGSQLHLKGIKPDYNINLTKETLTGTNEFLKKAKEVLNKENENP